MNVLNNFMKRRGAGDSPVQYQLDSSQDSKCLIALQEVRDIAWHYAVKYRFDPVLGKTHEVYLDMLNNYIKECT